MQQHVIKFVSNLRQIGGFLRVLRIPPPIKLTATEILLMVELNTIKPTNHPIPLSGLAQQQIILFLLFVMLFPVLCCIILTFTTYSLFW